MRRLVPSVKRTISLCLQVRLNLLRISMRIPENFFFFTPGYLRSFWFLAMKRGVIETPGNMRRARRTDGKALFRPFSDESSLPVLTTFLLPSFNRILWLRPHRQDGSSKAPSLRGAGCHGLGGYVSSHYSLSFSRLMPTLYIRIKRQISDKNLSLSPIQYLQGKLWVKLNPVYRRETRKLESLRNI